MQFFDNTKSQIEFLTRRRASLRSELKKMPRGNLEKKISKGKAYYYEQINGKNISLNDNIARRELYFKKEWIMAQLSIVEKDLILLQSLIKKYKPLSYGKDIWFSLTENSNSFMEEEKKHLFNGVLYRSKGEMAIAERLDSFDVEFKYEVPYEINGRIVYPDFVVRRKSDGKIFIWEHAGLTGDSTYVDKLFKKLRGYMDSNFKLWDNLIITFDKEDGSLDVDYIDKIIKLYLL